jgi:hypothetical protein
MNGLLKVPMQFFICLPVLWYLCFQFNPVPLNFNPNNKVTVILQRGISRFRKKLDALSEDKKVINLLYIDQLNQDYDNYSKERISSII